MGLLQKCRFYCTEAMENSLTKPYQVQEYLDLKYIEFETSNRELQVARVTPNCSGNSKGDFKTPIPNHIFLSPFGRRSHWRSPTRRPHVLPWSSSLRHRCQPDARPTVETTNISRMLGMNHTPCLFFWSHEKHTMEEKEGKHGEKKTRFYLKPSRQLLESQEIEKH